MKRLYVHENIYDEVCDELASIANDTIIGDGAEQGTKLGPLNNKMQYDKVKALIEDAKQEGQRTTTATYSNQKRPISRL